MNNSRLINTCRWSSSRESTFRECQKKYWYSYYGAWEGWPKTPFDARTSISPLSSYLYMLKNMQPAAMFLGSLVHKVIEEALKNAEHSRSLPPVDVMVNEAIKRFGISLQDSKNKAWKEKPKQHTNLLEHYYGLPFGASDEEALKEKITRCIRHWHESKVVSNIALHRQTTWGGIESTQTFSLDEGIEAIVVYDFFVHWKKADGSSTMLIFDWKTGKENSKIDDQLSAYALAATCIFKKKLQEIIVSPFYLLEGPGAYKKYGVGQDFPIQEETLAATKDRICTSAKTMLALHPKTGADGTVPTPDPTLFAYPTDKRGCRRCPFQELCLKADFQEKSYDELLALVSK